MADTDLVQCSDDGVTWFLIDLVSNLIVGKNFMGRLYEGVPVVEFGSVRPDRPTELPRPPLHL